MSNQLKHDALFKKIMVNQIAAKKILEHYLPKEVKEIVYLTKITIESFVEDDLKRALSDLVYSVKTKDNEQAFVFVLIEAEIRPKYWMALKLWKYSGFRLIGTPLNWDSRSFGTNLKERKPNHETNSKFVCLIGTTIRLIGTVNLRF